MSTAALDYVDRTTLDDAVVASLVARQSRTDDGTKSVPDQIEAMKAWCATQTPPIVVGNIYTELSTSGRKPLAKRKGLRLAVEDVASGRAQMVLTCYFDRFVRSVQTRADVLTIVEEKHGGSVMTMDFGKTSNATPASKFTGTILAAVAEFQADQVGEKTHVSKQRNIDQGIPPFPRITPAYERITEGDDKGKLRPHSTNASIVREAIKMRLRTKPASFTEITRFLNDNGIEITQSNVEGMFRSKLLIGEIHFGKFRPNLHAIDDPICDRATFARLQKMRATRGRYSKSDRLLARLDVLHCGTCDSRMVVQSTTGKSGKLYAYYRCGNPLCKRPAIISAPYVEEFVRDEAIKLSKGWRGRATHRADLDAAREARDELHDRLGSVIRTLAVTAAADHPEARKTLAELQADYDKASRHFDRLDALTTPTLTVTTTADWDRLTLDAQRVVVHSTIARAVVAPAAGRTGPRVAPGRVTVEPRPLLSEQAASL